MRWPFGGTNWWRAGKWVLAGLGSLLLMLVALPFLLPSDVYKQQIIEQTRLATGRELAIDGELSISFWPQLGVEVSKVRFANAKGATEADMASIGRLVVGAEFWPLLSGELKVTELRLVDPVIHLEIDKEGRGNWLFDAPAGSEAGSPQAARPSGATGDISFRDVTLSGGVVTWRDARTNSVQNVEAIEAVVTLPGLDQKLGFEGGFNWNGEALRISAALADPRALSSGMPSALLVTAESDLISASFDGEANAGSGGIKGKTVLRAKAARQLARWAGVALPGDRGFGKLSIEGQLETAPGRIEFKNASVTLDGMHGTGEVTLETQRATPYARGRLALDVLDLNPYLGAGVRSGHAEGNGMAWSDAPADFSGLKAVDADLAFSAGALKAGGIETGNSVVDISISSGRLTAKLKQLALYGGSGTGIVSLWQGSGTAQFAVDLSLSGVRAEPFLVDAAGFDRLSGTGTIAVEVAGAGDSQRAWARSLDGEVRFKLEDGAIKGVNLAETARTIQSALSGSAVGPSAKTDFAELSASFAIKDGVAANNDLKLLNPFVRLNGRGIADVGAQTLNYRLEPKAVRSIEGQGGQSELAGIGIPFKVKGPWNRLSYSPDLSGVVDSAVEQILKGENPLENLKNKLRGEGAKPPEDGQAKPAEKQNPLDSLKGLFGQ